ncbi:MAG TPA: tRNA (N(6)-L-threonylcarbamoyladenosine(37)-C(2))-methylthiotransferase MtaB [Clostridiales bacterium]|nr:tRNA (N(6)-L-threonylcarbamoyladenosine(37)-C(2))-methylthiotransferase MtaB [Clostridiales bacterium]
MKKVAFCTLGCKVNQYESEAVSNLFENAGYTIVDFDEIADIYVINTCTVTGISARKSRQMVRRAKSLNREAIIVVMGCYSQTSPEEVSNIPGVDLIIGTSDRNKIIEYVEEITQCGKQLNTVEGIMKKRDFEELHVDKYKERTRAYLKIQEGCTQFCSYCIIPYARGPVRSRNPEEVLKEVKRLSDNGFKEVILTGIHVASYGRDLRNTSLLDIICRIHEVDGIERIRLSSIEPTTITNDFVQIVKNLNKLCPHYHISLQSGCDETLKRMNRKYDTSEYRSVVERLRDNINDVAITTDVMVGFPGESDNEFEQTYEFLQEICFSKMHVFKFSPRKGTPAYSFTNQVPGDVKEERSRKLIELSDECALKFQRQFEGRTMPVLFEQEAGENSIEGLTPNYIRVFCRGSNSLKGEIRDVVLKNTYNDFMDGEIINP